MPAHTDTFSIRTRGKGTIEITDEVAAIVRSSDIRSGTVTVFVQHTSASLVIMENADPSARRDLEEFFERLVPEDTPWFVHTLEGADDMAEIRLRRFAPGGQRGEPAVAGRTSPSRASGFPRLALFRGAVYLAWVDVETGDSSRLRLLRVPLAEIG